MISEGVIMPWVLLALKLLLQTDRLKLLWFFWGWEREMDEILDLIRKIEIYHCLIDRNSKVKTNVSAFSK